MTWQQIARLFEEMELRLIASLVRNLAGHREWEKKRKVPLACLAGAQNSQSGTVPQAE